MWCVCVCAYLPFLSVGFKGFDAKPGSNIPREIVEEAARRKIDLSEEQPCAAFNLREDLDMHDFVFCLDRRIREKMLIRAEQISRDLKLDYAAWERKIRLVKDIAGDKALTQSAWELDISKVRCSFPSISLPPSSSPFSTQNAL